MRALLLAGARRSVKSEDTRQTALMTAFAEGHKRVMDEFYDARSALVRSGMAETLLSLLEGPPKAEATILAVDALNGLGLTAGKLGEMCEEHPIRLATLELLSELDEEQRDALTPTLGAHAGAPQRRVRQLDCR